MNMPKYLKSLTNNNVYAIITTYLKLPPYERVRNLTLSFVIEGTSINQLLINILLNLEVK